MKTITWKEFTGFIKLHRYNTKGISFRVISTNINSDCEFFFSPDSSEINIDYDCDGDYIIIPKSKNENIEEDNGTFHLNTKNSAQKVEFYLYIEKKIELT